MLQETVKMNELLEKKEILTIDEVMEILKIGRSIFYKLIMRAN